MYEDIKEQFAEVIRCSQGIDDPKLDELFDRWAAAKDKFIKRFGGLIYEWPLPMDFFLDEEAKKTNVRKLATSVDMDYHNDELSQFILDNEKSFYDNKISDESYNLPKGMKLVKAFKHFEKDKKVLRKVQDMASELIQENKVCGTLCFSVHPLDFLSSSENTYKWSSCHSLSGDYRGGNLSYMTDESTFMVYLKGENNAYLPNFGEVLWNSKKWRMLMFTSKNDELLFAGRQYPFSSKTGIDMMLKIYNNLLMADSESCGQKKYEPWQQIYIDSYLGEKLKYRYALWDKRLVPIEDLIYDGDGALNYNDLLCSPNYLYPYYTKLQYYSDDIVTSARAITVGHAVTCLHCGKDRIYSGDLMRCNQCELDFGDALNENITTCDCCGRRTFVDNAYWIGDLDLVCADCFNQHCFECQRCGDYHFISDRYHLYNEDDDIDEWVCESCYEGYFDWKEQEREEKSLG